MNIKGTIRRILLIAAWSVGTLGGVVLLVAAINKKNNRTCSGSRVEINGGNRRHFLDQQDVMNLLTANGKEKLAGRTIISCDLRGMEELLKKNIWVRDAQLFFDNNEMLRVKVTEREPVARVFSVNGESFYVDSSGTQLPLSESVCVKVPVFTGYPVNKFRLRGPDSTLADQTRKLAAYILRNPFWMADIQQVNISTHRSFQLVPVIGNHIVEFGDGNDCAQKFRRLFVFYKDVLSRTGFDKYASIDVRFAGQVIGTKRNNYVSKSDSLQAMKNIEQLIRTARQMQADTLRSQDMRPLEHNTVTEQTLVGYDLVPADEDSTAAKAVKGKRGKK
ncbi:MAG TPA: hypothetical protein VMI35_08195 [Puia sp.]|nr:hypothetical protein [Puia sp.]